jgi:hypothetical protein
LLSFQTFLNSTSPMHSSLPFHSSSSRLHTFLTSNPLAFIPNIDNFYFSHSSLSFHTSSLPLHPFISFHFISHISLFHSAHSSL